MIARERVVAGQVEVIDFDGQGLTDPQPGGVDQVEQQSGAVAVFGDRPEDLAMRNQHTAQVNDLPQIRTVSRNWDVSMDDRIGAINRFTTGWMAYFRLADSDRTFRDLGGWLRRRLRQSHWKHWKTTAARRHNLRIRGISERNARQWAGSGKGYWRVAGSGIL